MSPLLTAIVLNYRAPKVAWRCIEALCNQTIADRMEILVVDNHSEDDSIGLLRNRARSSATVRIIETPNNIGYGQGNAAAIRQARGEFLLIINPDNILEPAGAENMIDVLRRDPRIGIVGPRLVHEDGTIRDSSRAFPTLADVLIKRTILRHLFPRRMERYLQQSKAETTAQRDVDWVVGACMLLRRDLYERLGGFDPRYFLFFEDIDLCRRCKDAGFRVIYLPTVRAMDQKKRLSEGGPISLLTKKTARIHLMSALKYFWKWRGER